MQYSDTKCKSDHEQTLAEHRCIYKYVYVLHMILYTYTHTRTQYAESFCRVNDGLFPKIPKIRGPKICHSTPDISGTVGSFERHEICSLLSSGFQPKQLQEAGFHLKDMMMAGYSFPEVLIAGQFPVQEVGATVGYFFNPRGATSDSCLAKRVWSSEWSVAIKALRAENQQELLVRKPACSFH